MTSRPPQPHVDSSQRALEVPRDGPLIPGDTTEEKLLRIHDIGFCIALRTIRGGTEEAGDIASEAIVRSLEKCSPDESFFESYFHRVLKTVMSDYHRTTQRLVPLNAEHLEQFGEAQPPPLPPPNEKLIALVHHFLNTLDPVNREAFRRVLLDGDSYAEVSQSTGRTVHSERAWFNRTRRRLQEQCRRAGYVLHE